MPNEHKPRHLPSDELPPESEHMWPLDLALVALGASMMYMAASKLGWDDPRLMYNAKTYAIVIPAGMVLIDLLLRNVASKFVQRSMQFGFLVSMFFHLLLLIVAVNVVILARYWPEAVVGAQPDRAPVRKTLPDNLFRANPEAVVEQPDWSRPVEATSEARVVPLEAQRIQRVDDVAERIKMPNKSQEQHEPQPFLIPRQQPTEAQPTPADAPARLARQVATIAPNMRSATESIQTPELREQPSPQRSVRPIDTNIARSRARGASAVAPRSAPESRPAQARSQTALRRELQKDVPQITAPGEAAAMSRKSRDTRPAPAMSAPAVPSFSIARSSDRATRQLSDRASGPPRRSSQAAGASLAPSSSSAATASAFSGDSTVATASIQRHQGSGAMPNLSASAAAVPSPWAGRGRLPGRQQARNSGSGSIVVPTTQGYQGDSDSGRDDGPQLAARGNPAGRTRAATESMASLGAPTPLAVNAQEGPAGLARELAPRTGFHNAHDVDRPMISIQPNQARFQRRPLGGLTPPPSQRVASVEPFRRRLSRTAGGAAPAAAGLIGPETEQAIELGLAFLAERQKDDGSWSLQGHGEDVLLRSDTAATALCVLAFQGAGYTHLKHQYAGTVAKALDYMKKYQRDNGDLFRSEDSLSNRNVWLYSHSIAALAMCEAFGMTQDPDLEESAQKAIDFIAESQHPTRGGWRYQPQVSSDTSVTGWMMMALKSGELAGLKVPEKTYQGIDKWISLSQSEDGKAHLFRYNPYALDTPQQRHGREVTPTMTAVGLLIRLYRGWGREHAGMQAGTNYLLGHTPELGSARNPRRDTYYWYYATQVMFHMGGEAWETWNNHLHPLLIHSQEKEGQDVGSWDPTEPIPDRWSPHAGRLYLTTLNLLSLEVYYRHLPIYEATAR